MQIAFIINIQFPLPEKQYAQPITDRLAVVVVVVVVVVVE